MDVTDVVDDTARVGASVHEALRTADFAELTPAEARDAAAMLAALRPRLPLRPSRRRRPGRRGNRLAARLMLRSSLGAGGEPVAWRWWQRRTRPRPIALVCDVSGSIRTPAGPGSSRVRKDWWPRCRMWTSSSRALMSRRSRISRRGCMKQWLETRDVVDFLARVRAEGKRAALATVVRVRGSAYRHEGAKLVVAEDGSPAGNVSGGCLEQAVREVALQVIRTGDPQLRSYCSSADEIAAWDLGVGCEGQVDVYVEVAGPRPKERALLERREPFAVATIVGMRDARCGMRRVVAVDRAEGDLGSEDLNAGVASKARE